MATKYFCDPCGKEIDESANRGSFTVEKANSSPWPKVKVSVEAMVSLDGTTNAGHICRECIEKVVAEGLYTRKNYRL